MSCEKSKTRKRDDSRFFLAVETRVFDIFQRSARLVLEF